MIKTFSISKDYLDIMDHLKKQQNASKYICELIRQDMNSNSLGEQVKQIVKQLLAKESRIDSDITESIRDVLGM